MSQFRTYIKFLLFLSSYVPLFFLLSIEFLSTPPWFIHKQPVPFVPYNTSISLISTLLAVFYLLLLYSTYKLITIHRKNKVETRRVDQYQQKNELLSSYLLVYVFSFVGLNFKNWGGVISFLVFFLLLWILQSKSEMLYINPLLGIFGYRVYEVTSNNRVVIVLSQKALHDELEIPQSQQGNRRPNFHKIDLVSLGENVYITTLNHEQKEGI